MIKSPRWRVLAAWLTVFSVCRADVGAPAIALNCFNCHRAAKQGSKSDIPALNRLSAIQLRQALLDFKYNDTQATLMPRLARGYSDDELAAVAAYIADSLRD